MSDDLSNFLANRNSGSDRPLTGMTVLVVEDSRFACEAVRLLCLRSGARIRRADCIRSARRHLATYRPTVVIVDLGLPDGSGTELIAEIAAILPRVPVLLGTSGQSEGAAKTLAAGADGFLAKPVESLAAFQQTILRALPPDQRSATLRALPDDLITPDTLALRDDLSLVAGLLGAPETEGQLDYVAQFLSGLALSARDTALADAASALAQDRRAGLPTRRDVARLSGLVQQRLAAGARF